MADLATKSSIMIMPYRLCIMVTYTFLAFLYCTCASGDSSRFFPITVSKSSAESFRKNIEDSLPEYGFLLYEKTKDTLISIKYVKAGSLNEREVRLLLSMHNEKPYSRINLKITTFFRKDTIIEYYDDKNGFPASNRNDFMDAIRMIKRLAEATLPPKRKRNQE